jgi:hypothetical protein
MGFNPRHEWHLLKNAAKRLARPLIGFAKNPRRRIRYWQRGAKHLSREAKSYWDAPKGRWALAGLLSCLALGNLFNLWAREFIERRDAEIDQERAAQTPLNQPSPRVAECMSRSFKYLSQQRVTLTNEMAAEVQEDCRQLTYFYFTPNDPTNPDYDVRRCFMEGKFKGTLKSEDDLLAEYPGEATEYAAECLKAYPVRLPVLTPGP